MSEKKAESKPESGEAGAKKGGKGKLIIIAVVATVALAGGGAAAAFMLMGKKGEASAAAEAKPAARTIPVFVDLDAFTVNLRDKEDSERFMQVKLVAEVKDAATGDMVKTLMPSVRNEVLLLLGSKKVEDIETREGKEKLAREIVLAANKPLVGTAADKGIEGVNFTHLIVQ
jgi:flagellar protein FliL